MFFWYGGRDADALGLSIRAFSTYSPESELTKIASGATVFAAGERRQFGAPRVAVVDPTGAGA